MRLLFAGSAALAALVLLSRDSVAADPQQLGWLSAKFEAARDGPLAYNPGKFKKKDPTTGAFLKNEDGSYQYIFDKGGPSYGTYQMASKRGIDGATAAAFVKAYYEQDFRDPDKPGSSLDPDEDTNRFKTRWAEVARREGDRFTNNEHEFIYDTHYLPLVRAVKEKTGLDIEARGGALRNVAWSVAVQHGVPPDPKATGVDVFERALAQWTRKQLETRRGTTGSVVDAALIDAVYDERSRKKPNGQMVYFGSLDQTPRFKQERSDAQRATAQEPLSPDAPDLNQTALGKMARGMGIIAGPPRRKNPDLFVEKGQGTFDFGGFERDFSTSRKPSVPNDHVGIRLGRYDLGRVTSAQAEKDLRAAGLPEAQVKLFAAAAGLNGDRARKYLDGFHYTRMSAEAKALGLKGAEASKYISEHSPRTIDTGQQKKLFEIAYASSEEAAARQFPGFDKFPAAAKVALVDMVYDRGADVLSKEQPRFVEAVRAQRWSDAAPLSRRNGAGVERNELTRALLEQAAGGADSGKK